MTHSNRPDIFAFVSKGPDRGGLLYPHRYHDGRYVVSMTRFKADYIYVDHPSKLIEWLEEGFSLRMSNPERGIESPRLVKPQNIFRPVIF